MKEGARMPNQSFTEELIHAHVVLTKTACRQERVIEWLARELAGERGCPLQDERRCPACEDGRDGLPCWRCWAMRAGNEAGEGVRHE